MRLLTPSALLPVLALSCAALASACSPGGSDHAGHSAKTAETAPAEAAAAAPAAGGTATVGTLSIASAQVRPPPGGRDVTAAYLTIANSGAADRLIGATSPEAQSIELHTHTHSGGMMKMEKVDGVDVPANGTVVFEQGGLHLMVFGVSAAASGAGPVPITLQFQSGTSVTVPFAVAAP